MGAIRSFPVRIEEVHSGDDLVVMADLGIDKLYKKVRCRLAGVDTPNAYKEKTDSEAGKVRQEIRDITQQGDARVEVVSEGKGGWLIILYVIDPKTKKEVNVNEMLKQRGYVFQNKADARNYSENQTHSA